MLHRRTLAAALALTIGVSAALAWGRSSAAAASRADAPDVRDTVAEPSDPLAGGKSSTYCPIPPRATPVPTHGPATAADSLLVLGGQSTLTDTAESLQCPGVPVPTPPLEPR